MAKKKTSNTPLGGQQALKLSLHPNFNSSDPLLVNADK